MFSRITTDKTDTHPQREMNEKMKMNNNLFTRNKMNAE